MNWLRIEPSSIGALSDAWLASGVPVSMLQKKRGLKGFGAMKELQSGGKNDRGKEGACSVCEIHKARHKFSPAGDTARGLNPRKRTAAVLTRNAIVFQIGGSDPQEALALASGAPGPSDCFAAVPGACNYIVPGCQWLGRPNVQAFESG